MIDLIGHIGYALLVVGMVLIARKRRAGWAFRVTGTLTWTALGFALELSSVVVWGFAFAVLDVYGWVRWRPNR